MFTGIVEEIGQILSLKDNKISISCSRIIEDIHLGDSISVDGVCLTVVDFNPTSFVADLSYETMRVTRFADLKSGDYVNLERAMMANSRFGGHIVSGHIDTVGQITSIIKKNEFYDVTASFDKEFSKYTVKKGSIAINGISLTIYDLNETSVSIAIIPHTFENTSLKTLKTGSNVNIEFDVLAKYVEKNLLITDNKSNITKQMLIENGFM